MTRVYDAAAVHEALAWEPLAEAIVACFLAAPVTPLRHAHTLPEEASYLIMPAWDERLLITKLVTVIPQAKPTVRAHLLALDRASGALLALIDGEAVTLRRTAATSALVARRLAARKAHLLLVGTGHLAPWMARAYLALVPELETLTVWGRRPDAADALVASLRACPEARRRRIAACANLAQAAAAADMICCATTSQEPLIQGAWLRPGTHLDLVGGFRRTMREADDAAIAQAAILVDTYAGALAEAGDLVQPLERGVLERSAIRAELAEWLRGERSVRESVSDITLFKSVGTAIEDLAAVHVLLDRTKSEVS